MGFRNAFKILFARFGLAWSLILFIVFFALIVGSVSLTIVLPVVRAFENAGIIERITGIFTGILGRSLSGETGAEIQSVWAAIIALFRDDRRLTVTTTVMFFVVVLIYKFLLGFYELPAYEVLEGAMSANARIGFTNAFVSKLGRSSRFVLAKMLYTTLYDAVFYSVLYLMLGLFFLPGGAAWGTAAVVAYMILFQSLRYTLIAFWGPEVTLEKAPVFQSFAFSVKKAGRNFFSVFWRFALTWVLIITLNLFIGIFTFGVGLIATVPVSMLFICILNMTLFYGKTGRRYYANGEIITPAG